MPNATAGGLISIPGRSELIGPLDITSEEYREYEWGPVDDRFTYRIDNPKSLYFRDGGTTHRVVDTDGITHCVPAPGCGKNCVLRWKSKQEVSF